jgi:hypothetical protein
MKNTRRYFAAAQHIKKTSLENVMFHLNFIRCLYAPLRGTRYAYYRKYKRYKQIIKAPIHNKHYLFINESGAIPSASYEELIFGTWNVPDNTKKRGKFT